MDYNQQLEWIWVILFDPYCDCFNQFVLSVCQWSRRGGGGALTHFEELLKPIQNFWNASWKVELALGYSWRFYFSCLEVLENEACRSGSMLVMNIYEAFLFTNRITTRLVWGGGMWFFQPFPGRITYRPAWLRRSSYANEVPKSGEILMFVCLQKDVKQCCDATKFDRTHCAGQWHASLTSTMSMIELCGITALFGIFLETNKHQNLTRLRCPIMGCHLAHRKGKATSAVWLTSRDWTQLIP